MIRTGTVEAAQANRRYLNLANGTGYWRTDLIVSDAAAPGWTPQAFLVEQDPDSVILPHFHQENEFQVVVAGGGTLGRNSAPPVSVHYAGRHTGYGPITSGPTGLWYLSLRAKTDPGALFLPESRSRLDPAVKKRHLFAHADALFEPQIDGLAAWMLSVAPGAPLAAPAGRGPRYYLVVDGELQIDGAALPKFAVAFADEVLWATSHTGATVLVLQFPS